MCVSQNVVAAHPLPSHHGATQGARNLAAQETVVVPIVVVAVLVLVPLVLVRLDVVVVVVVAVAVLLEVVVLVVVVLDIVVEPGVVVVVVAVLVCGTKASTAGDACRPATAKSSSGCRSVRTLIRLCCRGLSTERPFKCCWMSSAKLWAVVRSRRLRSVPRKDSEDLVWGRLR